MSPEKLLLFLVMLSVLVVFHEWGHFLLARRNGIRVDDFGIGMGPTLLKWTSPRSGTNYRLNLFPIGGYCAMKGEDGKSTEAEQQRDFQAAGVHDEDNFQAKRPWQRMSVVLAGPIANFLIAIVLLFMSAAIFGLPDATPTAKIYHLVSGFPAEQAGLRAGDTIVAIDGVDMPDGNAVVERIHAAPNTKLRIAYLRDGQRSETSITPRAVRNADGKLEGRLGFEPMPATHRVSLAEALGASFRSFWEITSGTLGALGGLFTHFSTTASQLQGPIGMARIAAQVEDFGWGPYLFLAASLSISLGIFNLLPFPALDGGRAVFILVELARGKPVDPEKEALVHVGGFAALIAVMLLVAYHDIARIFAGKAAF